LLSHFACFGLRHLDHIVQAFAKFHNELRPHQSLGNRTFPEAATGSPVEIPSTPAPNLGRVRCTRLLGGLLRHYERVAA
jgi:putative transposase